MKLLKPDVFFTAPHSSWTAVLTQGGTMRVEDKRVRDIKETEKQRKSHGIIKSCALRGVCPWFVKSSIQRQRFPKLTAFV